jgi:probable HAF family extracellular repeat protein
MFATVSVHSTMGKGAARWWRALWLAWVVVAWAALPSLAQRLIWLGTLGGDWSMAHGVSADGSVVVGWAENAAGYARAFRWTAAGGMEDLNITFAHLLTDGSELWTANAISPDGRYIVGRGYNAATGRFEAFLLDTRGTGVEERLTWLGTLGGGGSAATGVSADGSVVVGVAYNAAWQRRAFRWTAARGMQDLGTLGGSWSVAWGVSADGSVVVGEAGNAAGQERAFRWTAAGGMQDLGTLGGDYSWALGVSADGSVVVGWAENAAGQKRAFRWTAAGGMRSLGTLPGSDQSWATGVSADGSLVVGWAYNAEGQERAFRWTAVEGMQDLGTLGGDGGAWGVSADGSVVVGGAENAAGKVRAFRWTAARGMQDLGTLPGSDQSWAFGVSAGGSVVVGYAYNAEGQERAFRWTAAGGMEDLNITYAHLLTDGSVLYRAKAISPDGRYIVGQGYNAATGRLEAFLLDTRRTWR